ncbi:serine protease 1 [Hyalella azteca]|uniref:Serine protease 1 n=1 Tax=Hyalella azteca TaxID=294128 RepID=A0A8B7PF58_HYAAZ|nr:serine protease 1 [Hyalella azteca]
MHALMRACVAVLLVGACQALVRPGRIVGGEPVPEGDAMWQVSVQTRTGAHFCGGTLISDEWVVTAAHCSVNFKAGAVQVAYGGNTLDSMKAVVPVSRIIVHERYDPNSMVNDIALLQMAPSARSSRSGTPIPLETREDLGEENCRVTGFGRLSSGGQVADRLMGVWVPLRSLEDCIKDFLPETYALTDGHVCAGGGREDACQGDSGGPLVCCNQNSTLRSDECNLVGVVSWGIGCATPGKPGVYTKVAHYKSWIEENIGGSVGDMEVTNAGGDITPSYKSNKKFKAKISKSKIRAEQTKP